MTETQAIIYLSAILNALLRDFDVTEDSSSIHGTRVMNTLFNRFSHSTCTASIRSINLKRSIGERSLLTFLKKRSPTVKKSSSKRYFSKTKCFLMITR